jgi:hypothetical protein
MVADHQDGEHQGRVNLGFGRLPELALREDSWSSQLMSLIGFAADEVIE